MMTLALLASMLFAQDAPKTGFWIEEQTTVADGKVTPQIDGTVWHSFNDTFGLYGWLQAGKDYSQVYAGPTMKLDDWIQVGVAVGIEETSTPLRFGSFAAINKGDFSCLAVYEASKSGYWYHAETNIALNSYIGVGSVMQRFMGAGPRLELNLPQTPVKVWVASLYDWEQRKLNWLLGFRLSF